jgi:predicted component of type VI protein secretion system
VKSRHASVVKSATVVWVYKAFHSASPGGLNTNTRALAYVVDFDELEQVIWKTLARISKRDGAKIANEVAGRLADSLAQV